MPIFEIQGPDGQTYELDAPDEQAALSAFGMMGAQPAPGANSLEQAPDIDPSTGMPAGMVLDPETGQVIDTNARAELLRREGGVMQGASDMAGQFAAGTPIVGEYLDEAAGLVGGDMARENARAKLRVYEEANPGTATALRVAGGINGTIPMIMSGASFGANAAKAGQGLGRIAAGSAADGAIAGTAAGFGAGEGLEDRSYKAGVGAISGGGLGFGVPLATAGFSTLAKPLVAPIMSRMRPDAYARSAIGEGLTRSGSSGDDVVRQIEAARADGQDMFTVADAMGNSGQRMLSTIARTPNNERQAVVEAIQRRQSGQGDRLSSTLAEGFDAPDTAAARTRTLTNARTTEANQLYGRARASAGPVNVSPVLQEIDATLSPGVSGMARPADRIAPDSIEGALARVRSMISDGRSNLTDFNALFRAKLDLDDMIARSDAQGAGNRAHALSRVQRLVDDALAGASPDYAAARDAFSTASRRIDAVGEGSAAASGRQRAADTIPAFQGMSADEQAAFRSGYADPMIARVEAASSSPTTNKARTLITEKTAQEFPAMAAPGRGDQMQRRIGREQTMFETSNAALGGSKTADNLADAAEMSKFDPGVMTALFQGRPVQAVIAAATRALNESKGLPPSVVERIAKVLMETRPDVVKRMLDEASAKTTSNRGIKAVTNAILTSGASVAAAR